MTGKYSKYRTGVKVIKKSYAMAEDTIKVVDQYARKLEKILPTRVTIGEREIFEMVVHGSKRLIDDGKITFEDLFY